jgi:hypothetical protein
MKKYKNISDKQLQDLFKATPLEDPSPDFTRILMSRIEKEAIKEKKKRSRMVFWQAAAGISSMILLPGLVIYLCNRFLPGFSFSFSYTLPRIHPDSTVVLIGTTMLFLLIADTLIRKHIKKRHEGLTDNSPRQ